MGDLTICYKCQHFTNLGIQGFGGGDCTDAWYNHICNAHPLPLEFNPVTGKRGTESGNRGKYCRDVNTDGNCKDFNKK